MAAVPPRKKTSLGEEGAREPLSKGKSRRERKVGWERVSRRKPAEMATQETRGGNNRKRKKNCTYTPALNGAQRTRDARGERYRQGKAQRERAQRLEKSEPSAQRAAEFLEKGKPSIDTKRSLGRRGKERNAARRETFRETSGSFVWQKPPAGARARVMWSGGKPLGEHKPMIDLHKNPMLKSSKKGTKGRGTSVNPDQFGGPAGEGHQQNQQSRQRRARSRAGLGKNPAQRRARSRQRHPCGQGSDTEAWGNYCRARGPARGGELLEQKKVERGGGLEGSLLHLGDRTSTKLVLQKKRFCLKWPLRSRAKGIRERRPSPSREKNATSSQKKRVVSTQVAHWERRDKKGHGLRKKGSTHACWRTNNVARNRGPNHLPRQPRERVKKI